MAGDMSMPPPKSYTATQLREQQARAEALMQAKAAAMAKDTDKHILDAMMYGASGISDMAKQRPRAFTDYEKLKMRLNIGPDDSFGFDWLHVYKGPNTTFVFIVMSEKAIILEDDNGIFPSDRMVAQVRLMQEQK